MTSYYFRYALLLALVVPWSANANPEEDMWWKPDMCTSCVMKWRPKEGHLMVVCFW